MKKKTQKKDPLTGPKGPKRKKNRPIDLLTQVIRLTGIPSKKVRKELGEILKRKNLDPKKLTLADVRMVVASYLREIMSGLLDQQHH